MVSILVFSIVIHTQVFLFQLKRLKLRKNNWDSDTYEFDEVLTEFASQKRVYEVVAKPVVEVCINVMTVSVIHVNAFEFQFLFLKTWVVHVLIFDYVIYLGNLLGMYNQDGGSYQLDSNMGSNQEF